MRLAARKIPIRTALHSREITARARSVCGGAPTDTPPQTTTAVWDPHKAVVVSDLHVVGVGVPQKQPPKPPLNPQLGTSQRLL
ncbi:hypothetical protein Sfulv_40770 [Streptomyces fulvorobeus]|uniref:Uncharacterized protein n=1 Tax=Streptomyces fulvorobeus TaxID=284028 RepID=A0A7J0CC34_9ACTN|nr:hypothetical protein Sfulv_40770 [Streptomyces fulvorobeus]